MVGRLFTFDNWQTGNSSHDAHAAKNVFNGRLKDGFEYQYYIKKKLIDLGDESFFP